MSFLTKLQLKVGDVEARLRTIEGLTRASNPGVVKSVAALAVRLFS